MSLKIYLDDCANAKHLISLLRAAGHQVTTPVDAGLSGEDDQVHLEYAAKHQFVLITKDPDDYAELHQSFPQHAGILGVYQDNDRSRDMSYADIVRAIANLEKAGASIQGEFHNLNGWQY